MTDDNSGCFSIYLLSILTDEHMKETVVFKCNEIKKKKKKKKKKKCNKIKPAPKISNNCTPQTRM